MGKPPAAGMIHEPDSELPRDLVLLRRFATLMDSAVAIPKTNRRVGLDPLIGLIPGLGDAFGALVATVWIVEGIRHRVGIPMLLRITGSIAVDLLVGAIPLLGDLFDLAYASNVRNVERIVAARHRGKAPHGPGALLGIVGGVLLAILLILMIATVLLVRWVLRVIGF